MEVLQSLIRKIDKPNKPACYTGCSRIKQAHHLAASLVACARNAPQSHIGYIVSETGFVEEAADECAKAQQQRAFVFNAASVTRPGVLIVDVRVVQGEVEVAIDRHHLPAEFSADGNVSAAILRQRALVTYDGWQYQTERDRAADIEGDSVVANASGTIIAIGG